MNKLYYRYKKIVWISSAIIILAATAGLTSLIFLQTQKSNMINHNLNDRRKLLNKEEVFPKIEVKDYLPYLEYKNNQLIISDKLIATLIKDFANRITLPEGDLEVKYQKVSNQKINFHFTFHYQGQKIVDQFAFEINNN
ncbi:MHO_1590 family protein [Candidatus Mycoplasma pogonae]